MACKEKFTCILLLLLLLLLLKVRESRNRPGVAQRIPGGLGSQISWHSAHEGGEVVSLTHRPPLTPRNLPGTHFQQGKGRPQGHGAVGKNMSLKNPVTPPGIDPGSVRKVAQLLKHYATPDPYYYYFYYYYYYYLSHSCQVITSTYLQQTLFVGYIVLQPSCSCKLWYMKCYFLSLMFCTSTSALSAVCVRWQMWLFSFVVPRFYAFPVAYVLRALLLCF